MKLGRHELNLFHRGPQTDGSDGLSKRQKVALKVGVAGATVAIGAGTLFPGLALKAEQPSNDPPRPPGAGVQVDAHAAIGVDAPKVFFLGAPKAPILKVMLWSNQETLSPAQTQALELVRALVKAPNPEAAEQNAAALRTLAQHAGATEGEGALITFDQSRIVALAEKFEASGLPLDQLETALLAPRGHEGEVFKIDAQTARIAARALQGQEVLLAPQARTEKAGSPLLQALLKLNPQQLGALQQAIGVQPQAPALAEQAQALGAGIVDTATVTKLEQIAGTRELDLQALAGASPQQIVQQLSPVGARPDGAAARAEWYKSVVTSMGHQWSEGANELNIVGLRGFDVDQGVIQPFNPFGQWNDTIAVVWYDGNGALNLREFRATVDPGQTHASDAPDVNGDGAGDVAHLLEGQYDYHVGTHKGVGGAGNPNVNVPVARDTNHDGHISGEEEQASIARGDVGYGINLHAGAPTASVGGWSLGCQVTQAGWDQFHQLITPVMQADGQFPYTLIDARNLA